MAVHELRPPAETLAEPPTRSEAKISADRPHWQHLLRRVLDRDVLPRLVACGATTWAPPTVGLPSSDRTADPIQESEIVALTNALLSRDARAGWERVTALRARRVSLEKIYLHLFAPAANRLGDLWARDMCDFFDVSDALHGLKQLFETIRTQQRERTLGDLSRRVLLAPAPGESHTFGAAVVAEFFTMAGWDAAPCHNGHHTRLLASQWFDVAGFSLSSDRCLKGLRGAIAAARRASRNPAIGVIVGGSLFHGREGLAQEIGADGTATDAEGAVTLARSLLKVQQPM